MPWQDITTITASIIVALGGSGAIIIGLSGWLGKFWAERFMEKERSAHASELEVLRSELHRKNTAEIESIKSELASNHHRKLTSFHERLEIYKFVIDLFANFLFELQIYYGSEQTIAIPREKISSFEKLRMRTYAHLCILASQEVMDSHEQMVECILATLEGEREFIWEDIRQACLVFLNAARKDLGIDENKIEYRGNR